MNKVLEVILKLNDQFTAPLRGSEGGLKSFGSEMKSFIAGAVTLGGITAALNKAWNEADELTRSMQRVEGTAKIVNVPLEVVRDTAEAAAKTFGLSATSANNFASSAVTMAAKAGDASKATELMASVLDLAAARGISADDALEALNITLKGQDEGLDKLVQKNPSAYYQSWAEAAGRSAGSLTEVEKKLAIVDGLLADAAPVRGAFTDWLTTVDGKAFLAGQSMEEATAKFGIATETLRIQMLSAKATGADLLGGVVEFFQKLGVGLAVAWDRAGATFSLGIANIQIALGEFIAGNRLVLMVLGDTATEIGDRMANAGTQRKMAATRQLGELRRLQDEMNAEIEGAAVLAGRNIAAASEESAQAQIKSGKTVVRASKEDAAELVKIHEEAARIIAEVWGESAEEIERFIDDVVAEANILVGVQEALLATINDGMATVTEGAEGAKDATKGIGDEALNAARGAVALATEFGGLDEQSASVLNNVVNLADSLKNGFKDMAAGDMLGAIGAVAGILGSIFGGNPAHMALVRKNTERLAELRDRMGEILELNAPGAKVSAVQGLNFEDIVGTAITTNGRISAAKLTTYLAGKGLSLRDFREIAKDAGFDLDERNGTLDTGAVKDFIAGMKTAGTVGFGGDFAGQLGKNDFLNSILGVEGDGALAGLAEILKDPKNGSSVFASIFEGVNLADGVDDEERRIMRGRLGVLAQRYATGALSAADLNGLSNAQAGQVFSRISDLLGDPSVTGTGAAGIGAGSAPGNAFAGVTFASASYDLSVVLFGPIERIDTNLADIRAGIGTLVGLSTEIADNTARAAAYAASTAAAMSGTGLADMVDERLAAARDLSSAAEG